MNSNTVAALIRRVKTGTDDYGKPIYTETTTVLPGIYWPAGSAEAIQGEGQVVWQESLCLPAGTDVSAIDAVIPQLIVDASGQPILDSNGKVQGERFEVDGQPAAWPENPFNGWQPAFPVVLQLKRVTS